MHHYVCEKPFEYFKRKISKQTHQSEYTKITTRFDKAQEAGYASAEIGDI